MVSRFWDLLFKYGDKTKEKNGADSPEFKTYSEICEMLQTVYDEGERYKEQVFNRKAESEIETQAMKFPGLETFYDRMDGTFFYEMDGRRYDTAGEVVDGLLAERDLHWRRMKNHVVNKARKWVALKADSIFTGADCPTLGDYIDGKNKR